MLVEGKGVVAPKPIRVFIQRHEIIALNDDAAKRAAFRSYGDRADQWGKGLLPTTSIVHIGEAPKAQVSILVGLVGEYATKRFLTSARPSWQIEIDTELRGTGDGGIDILAFGLKVQVKTKTRHGGENLVKCATSYGWHCVVFCRWNMTDCVHLLGWTWKADVVSLAPQPSPFGGWSNFSVLDSALEPMSSMVSEIEAWKGAK
jgi:hypothetical protein